DARDQVRADDRGSRFGCPPVPDALGGDQARQPGVYEGRRETVVLRGVNAAFRQLLGHRRAEPESVPVGIDHRHLTGLPLGVARRLCGLYPTAANLAILCMQKTAYEIGGTANLAVARVLGQEERQPVAS